MSDLKNRVNTYLFVAQSLAQQAKTDTDTTGSKTALVGASLSLKQSWESWLEELAFYLKMTVEEICNESSEQALSNPDCQLLFSLKEQPGSWYNQLNILIDNPLFYYEKALSQGKVGQRSADESRISIVNVAAQGVEGNKLKEKSLLEVIADFKLYVQHCREQQTEW